MSGGSAESRSWTASAAIETVHVSPAADAGAGASGHASGPPVVAASCAPLVPHAIVAQPSETATGSLKLTVTVASTATSTAPAAGTVPATAGGSSATQSAGGVTEFLGAGGAATK